MKRAIFGSAPYMGLLHTRPMGDTLASDRPKVRFTSVDQAYRLIDSLILKNWINSDKILQLRPGTDATRFFRSERSIWGIRKTSNTGPSSTQTIWSPWAKGEQP